MYVHVSALWSCEIIIRALLNTPFASKKHKTAINIVLTCWTTFLKVKSCFTGKIIKNLDGLDLMERILERSPHQGINKEVLQLIINMSFADQNRKWWHDTNIISVLLGEEPITIISFSLVVFFLFWITW